MRRHPALKYISVVPAGDPTGSDFGLLDFCKVDSVTYLQENQEQWSHWGLHHGHPRPMFNWIAVHNFHSGPQRFIFCLDRSETTSGAEALMLVTAGHVVQCEAGPRPPLVCINFLEVAPWNQLAAKNRLFSGLGPILVRMAADLSLQRGYGGCVGLHSVAAAEEFYLRLGFWGHHCPNEYHELYVELGEDGARSLLVE